jgi:hypothetical protein
MDEQDRKNVMRVMGRHEYRFILPVYVFRQKQVLRKVFSLRLTTSSYTHEVPMYVWKYVTPVNLLEK